MALLIVQFVHPGDVHVPDITSVTPPEKTWNPQTKWNPKINKDERNGHRRTFVVNQGNYLDDCSDTVVKPSKLEFWCEWEPEAVQNSTIMPNPEPYYSRNPLSVFEPLPIKAPSSYANLHNTDPCVFGDEFKYCICSQNGEMTTLDIGSIILFGSYKNNYFRLDTVFVVRKWENFKDWQKKPSLIPDKAYETIALLPVSPADPKIANARIYFGATPENPVEGMFSFFPCLPIDQGEVPIGFPRPCIQIPNSGAHIDPKKPDTPVIMDNFYQATKRYTKYQDYNKVKSYWQCVANQVTSQGLKLGVRAAMPPLLTSTTTSNQIIDSDPDKTDQLSPKSC